jgi:hypothetical protein
MIPLVTKEGLADEFYDDIDQAIMWLENVCNVHTGGLQQDELLDLFVDHSWQMMHAS